MTLAATERLIRVHELRAFEAWLGSVAAMAGAPWLRWAAASVTMPSVPERAEPTVVVLVLLEPIALLGLGVLHLVAWWRVRKAVGREQRGYRVRIWVTAR